MIALVVLSGVVRRSGTRTTWANLYDVACRITYRYFPPPPP
jgi:hypothetical protein